MLEIVRLACGAPADPILRPAGDEQVPSNGATDVPEVVERAILVAQHEQPRLMSPGRHRIQLSAEVGKQPRYSPAVVVEQDTVAQGVVQLTALGGLLQGGSPAHETLQNLVDLGPRHA